MAADTVAVPAVAVGTAAEVEPAADTAVVVVPVVAADTVQDPAARTVADHIVADHNTPAVPAAELAPVL